MNLFYLISGVLIVLIMLVDAFWTTIWNDGGAGPITSKVTTQIWKSALALGPNMHRFLSSVGPVILVTTALNWLFWLWVGWTLIFLSTDSSIVTSNSLASTDFFDKVWYVGYNLLTVGNGDYKPTEFIWKIVSTLTAISGMTIVTLSLTYFLSVVSAVVNKTTFAGQVYSLGKNPEEIVKNIYQSAPDFHGIELTINSLSSEVSRITQQYLAYPILQFYHASHREESEVNAMALLDETLTLLAVVAKSSPAPSPILRSSLRSAIDKCIRQLGQTFLHTAQFVPPLPDINQLHENGITIERRSFENEFSSIEARRKKVLGLLHSNGWDWIENSRHH